MSQSANGSNPDLGELSAELAGQFVPFSWGFSDLAIEEDQLKVGKVAIESARGILRSGMPLTISSLDAQPEPLDVPADTRNEIVVLAPIGCLRGQREAVGTKLLLRLASELTGAHEGLGVARVIEKRSDGRVLLDHAYIPPALCVRGIPMLARYLQELIGLVRARREGLHHRVAGRDGWTAADMADFLLLQTLNRFEPVLSHLDQLPVVHPERLYATCLMLVGELATFGAGSSRAPALPSYRHDDLEGSFRPLADLWRQSLSTTLGPRGQDPVPIELHERRYGVRVAPIQDRELLRTASLVLGVNARVPGEDLRARFPAQTKIGPVERIRDLVNLNLPGGSLHPLPTAPMGIRHREGFSYFELEWDSALRRSVQDSPALALHVSGEFPDLALELWAVRRPAGEIQDPFWDPLGGDPPVHRDADPLGGLLGLGGKGPPVESAGELQQVELGASAPRSVSPGQTFAARFASYLQHLEAEVRQKLDEINRGRGEALLGMTTCRWQVGTPVSVRMSGDYFAVEPGVATFTWNGSKNIVSFHVRTNADAPCGWTQLCTEVSIEGVLVALLPMDIEITAQPGSTQENRVTGSPARSAFASYAAKDRLEVLARISAVSAYDSGLNVFYDWLDLLAGEDWRARLESEIAKRDVLLLFWSRNARESEWVEWEWRKAVEKKGLAAIRPMPIEPPDLAPPPEELKTLNFRDRYLVAQDAARRIAQAMPTAHDRPRFA